MKPARFVILAIWVAVANGSVLPEDGPKVVNGLPAKQGDFPFVVSVHQDANFLCAGVLVDAYWVLTSAICVSDEQFKPLKVSVGGVLLNPVHEIGRYDINVNSVTVHEDFYSCNTPGLPGQLSEYIDSYYYCNNLALLKLSTPALPSAIIQPIGLSGPLEITLPGTVAQFAGWGGNANSSPSPVLQVSNNTVTMDTAQCTNSIGITLSDLDVCTDKSDQDACEFDQGGPLFRLDLSRGYVLVGLVNYAPCGVGFPNVYASATGQRWWIQKVTGL